MNCKQGYSFDEIALARYVTRAAMIKDARKAYRELADQIKAAGGSADEFAVAARMAGGRDE